MSRKTVVQKSSHFLSSPLFLIGGTILFLFFSWAALNEYLRERAINNEVENMKKAIAELESKNEELESSLLYVQTPEFQELEAKRQLGLVKEGEKVIIFSDSNASGKFSSKDGASEGGGNPQSSNQQKWWNYFFDNR